MLQGEKMENNVKNSNENSGILSAELLFALYYNSFIFLKPLLITYYSKSTILLLGTAIVIVTIYIVHSRFLFNKKRMIVLGLLFSFVTVLFLVDYVFRRNINTWDSYYYFLIYGVVPLFLLINVYDYSKVLKYWCIFAFASGLELCLDPFNGYKWAGDYMQFGNGVMLPAFTASIVFATYYKKKKFWAFSILFFLEILMCANKGAFLTAIAVLGIGLLYFANNGRFKIDKTVGVLVVAFIFYFTFDNLVEAMIRFAVNHGINSYSLITFQRMISGTGSSIYDSRLEIWADAWKEFINNAFFGMGIGGFAEKYGIYAHNFFLDVLVSHGMIIACIVFVFTIKSILHTFRLNNIDKKLYFLIMLFLWFFPTMVSFTFWKIMPFWLFIGLNLYVDKQEINCEK